MQITVTNNDPFTRFGVSLQGNFPQDLVQLFESDPEFTGDCASTTCNTAELIQWPLVDLAAGQSFTVTLPPTVASGAVPGSLINFPFRVKDDQGVEARGTQALYNGCLLDLDGDCDGIPDTADNCTNVVNTNQRDTNGDGYGNACDPDLNNDGVVNFADIGAWVPLFNTACGNVDGDFNGDGGCNFGDYALFPQYFLQPPGPGAIDN